MYEYQRILQPSRSSENDQRLSSECRKVRLTVLRLLLKYRYRFHEAGTEHVNTFSRRELLHRDKEADIYNKCIDD